ncbi:acyl-CoA carboxylase subunit epsilon [Microbacterium hominis]|uniref:acyl-CoA carboxylase subunit epsilon n=1 Tax=Microbacterium TaxID=33882 RepID=UPI0007684ED8|nr:MULTISPECIES: acyl-CoA carboxylase subunit epsilon [Microbacterium]KXC04693.1 hypothetical protein MhomT_15325 [Microbacterium hominis]QOC26201.1 acyl-CoA carboxylase subunit epsilon [Microbacterium hominis]QOC30159.1 acyl-CoA carboxylase subunit epsilon [Microbacterium hominis]QRY41724.1 acyl-CoA carboxylase subunit epsilon [Microbacterium hominis]QYF97493.1 acyl-CoA carboxylase subunit epsilon [Microbacterium sp. PAMC21962]
MTASATPPPSAAAAGADAVRIDVRRGDPTPEELAAVLAVVTEAYEREAADAVADETPRRSAWELSARNLRAPLRREIGWGRFAG